MQSYLKEKAIDFIVSREPGGTLIGEKIRDILLMRDQEQLLPISELLLFFASRAQNIAYHVKPALEQGQWVLCDRFIDATFAYQGGGRGLPQDWIATLGQWVGAMKPDKIFLLDMPVELALKRLSLRGELDRFEHEKQSFFERVRQVYLERAAADPDRYHLIDASQPLIEVQAQLKQLLDKLMEGA